MVEEVVSDSQCGFKAGRGCMDMLFCVRQLVEKAIERNTNVLLLFVDHCTTYNSMPRQTLWCALQRYGVPENLIALVHSFHVGMFATITVAMWGEVITLYSD